MTPRDIFGIVVRSVGLSLLCYALYYLAYAGLAFFEVMNMPRSYLPAYLTGGAVFLVLGLYLLRGAPGLMGFAYPPVEPTWTDLAARDAAGKP